MLTPTNKQTNKQQRLTNTKRLLAYNNLRQLIRQITVTSSRVFFTQQSWHTPPFPPLPPHCTSFSDWQHLNRVSSTTGRCARSGNTRRMAPHLSNISRPSRNVWSASQRSRGDWRINGFSNPMRTRH